MSESEYTVYGVDQGQRRDDPTQAEIAARAAIERQKREQKRRGHEAKESRTVRSYPDSLFDTME